MLLNQDDEPSPTATTDSVADNVPELPAPPSPPNAPGSDDGGGGGGGGGGSGDIPKGESPDGLGDDPVLDGLAQGCFDGDMISCDALLFAAPAGSPYLAYGTTCGGRNLEDEVDGRPCSLIFP